MAGREVLTLCLPTSAISDGSSAAKKSKIKNPKMADKEVLLVIIWGPFLRSWGLLDIMAVM